MNILIIGASGFIGSHALALFRQKGHRVWGSSTSATAQPQMFTTDAQKPDWSKIFKKQAFDVCINCSGAAHVPMSFEQPQRDFQLNATNVYNILENIRLYNPTCKFINLSSAAVYGNPPAIPVRESMPLQPLSPYGFNKKIAEDICRQFAQCFQIQTCSLRIFSAFGEGLRKQIFWDVYQKSLQPAHKIELFGTGDESRDFIYIEDLIDLIEIVIQKADFQGETLNAASGVEVAIRDAVLTFLELLDWQGKLKFTGNNRAGDPLRWLADISRVQSFGFQPRHTLADGLQKYVKWLHTFA